MPDKNPYRTLHARMSPPGAAWDEGFAAGRAAERAANVKLLRDEAARLQGTNTGDLAVEGLHHAADFLARSVSPAPNKEDTDDRAD